MRAGGGGTAGADALIEVDRIHFSEQLSGFDWIADIDGDALHASCGRRANLVAAPGLDRADAKQRRCHIGDSDLYDRDLGRCQWPAAH